MQEFCHPLTLRGQPKLIHLTLVEPIRHPLDGQESVQVVAVPLYAAAVDIAGALHRDELPVLQFADIFHHGIHCQTGGSGNRFVAGVALVRAVALATEQVG